MDLHGLWSRLTGGRAGAERKAATDSGSPDGTASHGTGRHAAWRSLPPLAPAARRAPLVAQRAPFEPGLGGAAATPLALAPLGHERSLEAPAGLVAAVHAPVAARAADPVPSSVRPVGRGRRHERAESAPLGWPSVAEPPADDAPLPQLLDTAPAPPVPVVARSITAALTVAPAVDTPGGFVGAPPAPVHSAAATVARSTDELGEESAATAAGLAAEPVTAPLPAASALRDTTVARSVTDRTAAVEPVRPLTTRRNLGQSRRLRIGPAIDPVTRSSPGADLPAALQRALEPTPDPMPQLSPDLPVERRVAQGEAASAGLSVARSVAGHALDHADHASHDAESPGAESPGAINADEPALAATPPEPVFLRLVADERPALAPLLGTLRPIFDAASPAVAIGRAADPDEPDAAPTGVAAALAALDGPGSLPVTGPGQAVARLAETPAGSSFASDRQRPRGPGTGGPGGPGGVGGSTGARGGRPAAWADGVGNTSAGGSKAGPAAPFVQLGSIARGSTSAAVGVSRSATSEGTPPPGASPHAPAGGTARLRVGAPLARSVAPDVPDPDPGLLRAVAAGQPVAPSAGDAPPATVLRAVADPALGVHEAVEPGVAAFSEAGVQRAAGDAAPAAGPAPAGVTGSAGASGPTSGPELDALAARLYERIRLRLRRELLADRERAGILVDMGR